MYVRNNIYDYIYICAYNYINVYLRLQVGKHVHLSHCIKKMAKRVVMFDFTG